MEGFRLEVFKHLYAALAEEMGVVLRRSAYSPNIKERRDFSCAVFDSQGRMISQAAHIPVHLGSMPLSVTAAIDKFRGSLAPGDAVLLNDPFQGGTHLPDLTLVTPVFSETESRLVGFVASRAHHADVGGMAAGSMPIAREIYQEGLIIPPVRLFEGGKLNEAAYALLLANVRTPQERAGDLWAQVAANHRGQVRLLELIARYGLAEASAAMKALLAYTERLTRSLLSGIPDGAYAFEDFMDNDGLGDAPALIQAEIRVRGDRAVVDFTGTAPQQRGSINAVYAITLSAVYYVFRCLLGLDAPNNSGCLAPIQVIAPEGSLVNARPPAAVSAGNVETSQRIVDVLFGALAQALPDQVPAASQGTMNNLTIGGWDDRQGRPFAYYETVGGGMGARPGSAGPPAVHSHMTNTLNTPVEALEYAYPLRVRRYEIRKGSGGAGRFQGGDGICREIETLVEAQASLVSERRVFAPYGLAGGEPGKPGENQLVRKVGVEQLPGKCTIELAPGDLLCVSTPGGGGWGKPNVSR